MATTVATSALVATTTGTGGHPYSMRADRAAALAFLAHIPLSTPPPPAVQSPTLPPEPAAIPTAPHLPAKVVSLDRTPATSVPDPGPVTVVANVIPTETNAPVHDARRIAAMAFLTGIPLGPAPKPTESGMRTAVHALHGSTRSGSLAIITSMPPTPIGTTSAQLPGLPGGAAPVPWPETGPPSPSLVSLSSTASSLSSSSPNMPTARGGKDSAAAENVLPASAAAALIQPSAPYPQSPLGVALMATRTAARVMRTHLGRAKRSLTSALTPTSATGSGPPDSAGGSSGRRRTHPNNHHRGHRDRSGSASAAMGSGGGGAEMDTLLSGPATSPRAQRGANGTSRRTSPTTAHGVGPHHYPLNSIYGSISSPGAARLPGAASSSTAAMDPRMPHRSAFAIRAAERNHRRGDGSAGGGIGSGGGGGGGFGAGAGPGGDRMYLVTGTRASFGGGGGGGASSAAVAVAWSTLLPYPPLGGLDYPAGITGLSDAGGIGGTLEAVDHMGGSVDPGALTMSGRPIQSMIGLSGLANGGSGPDLRARGITGGIGGTVSYAGLLHSTGALCSARESKRARSAAVDVAAEVRHAVATGHPLDFLGALATHQHAEGAAEPDLCALMEARVAIVVARAHQRAVALATNMAAAAMQRSRDVSDQGDPLSGDDGDGSPSSETFGAHATAATSSSATNTLSPRTEAGFGGLVSDGNLSDVDEHDEAEAEEEDEAMNEALWRQLENADGIADATGIYPERYNPVLLDDPSLTTGKHKTVIALPGMMGSIIQYTRPSDLKKELNEKFRETHPEVDASLTLSQIRNLKRRLIDVGKAHDLEIASLAKSFVYIEKLILKRVVVQSNRRLVGGICLLLATKVNEPKGLVKFGPLMQTISKILEISTKDIREHEWTVFTELEFDLYLSQREFLPHFERILSALDYGGLQEYLGESQFWGTYD